jgi:hypothetical protein
MVTKSSLPLVTPDHPLAAQRPSPLSPRARPAVPFPCPVRRVTASSDAAPLLLSFSLPAPRLSSSPPVPQVPPPSPLLFRGPPRWHGDLQGSDGLLCSSNPVVVAAGSGARGGGGGQVLGPAGGGRAPGAKHRRICSEKRSMLGSKRTSIIQRSRSPRRSTGLGFAGDSPPADDAITDNGASRSPKRIGPRARETVLALAPNKVGPGYKRPGVVPKILSKFI